jgi:hypothetical protein
MRIMTFLFMMAWLVACSGGPTTPPPPPPPPPPGPVIAAFVAEPYVNQWGDARLRIAFVVNNAPRETTTLRLGAGPLNSNILIYHTPTSDYGPGWRWVIWNATDKTARYEWVIFWPTTRTTYTLEVSTPYGNATEARTVEPRGGTTS